MHAESTLKLYSLPVVAALLVTMIRGKLQYGAYFGTDFFTLASLEPSLRRHRNRVRDGLSRFYRARRLLLLRPTEAYHSPRSRVHHLYSRCRQLCLHLFWS